MMTVHSPLRVGHSLGYAQFNGVQVVDARGLVVAVAIGDVPELKPEEFARLIAASDDLLAAAKRALNVLKAQGESVRPGNALGALDAAIAKAGAQS